MKSTSPELIAANSVSESANPVIRMRSVFGASPHQFGFGVSSISFSPNEMIMYGWAEIGSSVLKSVEMSLQSATAAFLMMASNSVLYAAYGDVYVKTTCWAPSPASTDEISSYPAVSIDPGVFSCACHVHSKSSQV